MKKEHLAFLAAGFAFGLLFGVGLFNVLYNGPDLESEAAVSQQPQSPAGPRTRNPVGPSGNEGGAPMMARLNDLKRQLQEKPDDVAALVEMANIYYEVAMWENAAGYYERAVELREDPNLLTDLGTCYRGMSQFDRAVELFERAHEIDPEHWQALFNKAVVVGFDLGRYDQALEMVASLERVDPPPPRLSELRQALERASSAAVEQEG